MKWALLLVVCQIVSSYRPEIWTPLRPESDDADVPERLTQCRLVDLKSLCQLQLKANDCLHVEDTKATKGRTRFRDQPKECYLRGPVEGVAVIYGGNATAPTVTVSGKASWIISGGLHFHGLRFQVPALRVKNARLTFYNTSAVKDGGAIYAGRGGLKLRESTVQVESSTARNGGAIALSAAGHLSCKASTIATQRTNATNDGGSIYAKNVRLENSSIQISVASANDGGGMMADMLVVKSSSIFISNTSAYGHGGATYSHRRLVLMNSTLRGMNCDASSTLASKGGAVYAFLVELRNASVEIDGAASGADGGCIHAVRSMMATGSSLMFSRCNASHGAVHVGAELHLTHSSMEVHNSSAQSSAALHCEKVFMNSSRMNFTKIHSQVPPVMLESSTFKMEGGSSLILLGAGDHDGFSAIELSSRDRAIAENQSFEMSADSSLVIADFFSGLLSDGGTVRLRNAQLQRLHYAVEMPRAIELDVADAVLEDVSELAFSCGQCRRLSLDHLEGFSGALLRAAELESWSLRHVKVRCSRSQVACVQIASALVFLDPEPWRLENVSLEAEDVSSDFAPVLLDVEGPKAPGSHSHLAATCPAGSFSFIQESSSIVSKTAEIFAMFEMMREDPADHPHPPGPRCCASTKTLPRAMRFLRRTFDFDFGIIPEMNRSCDPATYPCVCTTHICDHQILKTSLVSTRVSCMSCPMGQYSLKPYTRELKGDDSGLLGSSGSVLQGDCIACTEVAQQVGRTPFCAGRSVRVPKGIMAMEGGNPSGCSKDGLCFFRCPNTAACPGGDMATVENSTPRHCAPGYDDQAPGCSTCASGYGRQNLDAFECNRCGRWDLSLGYFLLLPVVPLLLAVRSASQTEKERMSMVIKVILSFGTFIATIQNILEQTETYLQLQQRLKVAVGLMEAEGGDGSSLVSASFDCLIGGTASRWHYLALQSFHSVAFLLMFAALEILGGTSNSFGASWIRRNIVLGNAFLPAIFSSFLQWTPCFHMKKNSDGSFQSFSVFQVTEECSSLLGFVMPCCGMLVFLALGPLHWIYMVSQSRKWENRKEYIGFLIAGYNEHCEWWEITVLLRKTFLIGSLVLLPVSYAPMSLVIVTVLIMLAALVGHLMMRPYVDPLMNLLEGGVLTYSMLALILTLYLMSESWTNTNKALVFFVLVSSNAVTCILLLAVFLVIALRRPGKQEAAVTAPIAG